MYAIVVVGPTASGKTAFAHKLADTLAKALGKQSVCELVNLDAFQFYRGFDCGTAKPSLEERQNYHYHGLDILDPHETLDAMHYAAYAHAALQDICSRQRIPIAVGGSGLYLRAFLHGLDPLPPRNAAVRTSLRAMAARFGWPSLHDWLKVVDPERANELHPNDSVRIERALEIYLLTGVPASKQRSKNDVLKEQPTLFPAYIVHVDLDDLNLRKKITERAHVMIQKGWCQEVENLYAQYKEALATFPAMRAIGYKDVLDFVQNKLGKEKLISNIINHTWQYAKRQRMWNAKELQHATFSWQQPEMFESLYKDINTWLNQHATQTLRA